MKRLTEPHEIYASKFPGKEEKNFYPPDSGIIYERLGYYEDLMEKGRLVTLPCAVGDKGYFVVEEIVPVIIKEITIGESTFEILLGYKGERQELQYWRTRIDAEEIGERLFFKREDTVAKIKEGDFRKIRKGDSVFVIDVYGKKHAGEVIEVNYFCDPRIRYGVDIGFENFVYVGEDQIEKASRK